MRGDGWPVHHQASWNSTSIRSRKLSRNWTFDARRGLMGAVAAVSFNECALRSSRSHLYSTVARQVTMATGRYGNCRAHTMSSFITECVFPSYRDKKYELIRQMVYYHQTYSYYFDFLHKQHDSKLLGGQLQPLTKHSSF